MGSVGERGAKGGEAAAAVGSAVGLLAALGPLVGRAERPEAMGTTEGAAAGRAAAKAAAAEMAEESEPPVIDDPATIDSPEGGSPEAVGCIHPMKRHQCGSAEGCYQATYQRP